MKNKHPYLGRITKHHIVPRSRIKDYYGVMFPMPYNHLRLWEMRHAAWHALFGLKTINEVIELLSGRAHPRGYQSITWNLLFKGKTKNEAKKLLIRTKRIIRKNYKDFEFDPALRRKLHRIFKNSHRSAGEYYLNRKFLKKVA